MEMFSELLAGLLVPVVGAVMAAFKSFRFVYEGELGIRLRFGRAVIDRATGKPKVIQPGFVLMIPWVDTLLRRHVRQQTISLNGQRFLLKDGMVVEVNGYVLFKVADVYRALFEVANLDQAMTEFAMGALRSEMTKRDYKEIDQIDDISLAVMAQLKERAEQWGVQLIAFQLTNLAPAEEVAQLTSITLRAKMLKEAAGELGYEDLALLPPQLAAVLVGAPLVASVGDTTVHNVASNEQRQAS